MRIGYTHLDYATRRNIVEQVPDFEYRRIRDTSAAVRSVAARLRASRTIRSRLKTLKFIVAPPYWPRVDLLHLWNGVSFAPTPWVTTFETVLPRYADAAQDGFTNPELLRRRRAFHVAIDRLAGSACTAMIALSDCAHQMQLRLLDNVGLRVPEIEAKLVTIRPPQHPLIDDFSEKPELEGDVRFLFVGRAFFRKGGSELLEACARLRAEGARGFHLTIVSGIGLDEYATQRLPADRERAMRIIESNRAWISHYTKLPPEDVLQLVRESHVGLLPSHAETFGYVVLEYQAGGCPVITTDVRAFPEINNEECGWMIGVPKSDRGEARYRTAEDRQRLSEHIREGVYAKMKAILQNPDEILVKGEAALERIRHEHAPERFAAALRRIYDGTKGGHAGYGS